MLSIFLDYFKNLTIKLEWIVQALEQNWFYILENEVDRPKEKKFDRLNPFPKVFDFFIVSPINTQAWQYDNHLP